MMKEALIVGAAGGIGGFAAAKLGGPLEAMAVKVHVPPVLAHGLVVAGVTTIVFVALRAVF